MTTPTENASSQCEIPFHGSLVNGRCPTCDGHDTAPQASRSGRLPAGGDLVVVLALDSVATGQVREVLALVDNGAPSFKTIDGEGFLLSEEGEAWRFAGDADKPVRRCTVVVSVPDGEPLCGAVLGRDVLDCVVCKGARCFPHCGSIDHFAGRLVSRGGTDSGLLTWRTREIADRFVMAQLYRETERGLVIVGTITGAPGEGYAEVFRRFERYVAEQAAAVLR